MIKLSPFIFNYQHFYAGTKFFEKCLELENPIEFTSNGLILITGESGSGKSTLLNIIKGLIPYYIPGEFSGEVWIENQKITKDNIADFNNKMVYLFQNPFSQLIHVDPNLELAFTMENLRVPSHEFETKKTEVIKKLGLEGRLELKTGQLSNGECQKLVLGSLIALSPKILLLDEPTAFLDPNARKNFYQIISKLKKDHLILLVDHHVSEVKELVDQFIFIKDKKVILKNDFTEDIDELKNDLSADLNKLSVEKVKIDLEVLNLSFSYNEKRAILSNVSLSASGGECIVITGENGQGKSTLFKLLSGVISSKNAIDVKINNKKICNKDLLKISGFVFQNPESNFFFNTLLEEVGGEKNKNLLKFFFDEKDFKRSPYLFSEGQKRRISILINLVLNKQIIYLDEPTFGQDSKNKKMIAEIILALKRIGKLVLIVSHDEEFTQIVSDKVFILKDSKLNAAK